MNQKIHPVVLSFFFVINLILKFVEAWLVIVSINFLFKLSITVNWQSILATYFLLNVALRNALKVDLNIQPKNKSQLING